MEQLQARGQTEEGEKAITIVHVPYLVETLGTKMAMDQIWSIWQSLPLLIDVPGKGKQTAEKRKERLDKYLEQKKFCQDFLQSQFGGVKLETKAQMRQLKKKWEPFLPLPASLLAPPTSSCSSPSRPTAMMRNN